MKYPHNNMITWNKLARDLAQMLTTCPLYSSLLCGFARWFCVKMVFDALFMCINSLSKDMQIRCLYEK